jgi:hypothetical protein
MRRALTLITALAVTACSSPEREGGGGMLVDLPEPELRASLAQLGDCASPLKRLGIKHPPKRVAASTPGEVTITIPSTEDSSGSTIRFEIDFDAKKAAAPKRLTWEFTLASNAAELDLGENRLLNPPQLTETLEDALRDYADYIYRLGLKDGSAQKVVYRRDAACRTFGRVTDGLAVITDANLRTTLERQKRRDALGWLFQDGYQLKTESPEGAYWEGEGDYSGNFQY